VIYYVDSSVILRVLLGQPGALAQWPSIEHGVASGLVEVECFRVLDRLHLARDVGDDELARRREALYRILASLTLVDPNRAILRRAAQPMPTALGSLDAIHLATALLWREVVEEEITMATHDAALARASRAFGLTVVGAA
jgi:predicted nucleic acid-binding protein